MFHRFLLNFYCPALAKLGGFEEPRITLSFDLEIEREFLKPEFLGFSSSRLVYTPRKISSITAVQNQGNKKPRTVAFAAHRYFLIFSGQLLGLSRAKIRACPNWL
jgi:hypothetical protein